MGDWNFSAGFVLLVIFLINIQALEAVPNGNSSHGSKGKVLPDFRRMNRRMLTEKQQQLLDDFTECGSKWLGTVGDPCDVDKPDLQIEFLRIAKTYKGDTPQTEYMKLLQRFCQDALICSKGRCKCKRRRFSCDDQTIPELILSDNCNNQSKGILSLTIQLQGSPNTGSNVIDPGQYFQYIELMAVILAFVVAN